MSDQTPIQPDWLVQTRLSPPAARDDVIARPRLLEALALAVASHPLTLLSAPAGYGKTTLLADCRLRIADCGLTQTNDDQIRNPKSEIRNRVAWLSLEEEDNDPVRFLACLIVVLGRLVPGCGDTAQGLLAGPPAPPTLRPRSGQALGGERRAGADTRRVIAALINDIVAANPDPFALILDDLHLITEPAVYVALDYLLERLPAQMRLVVGTRHDPPLALARLRARGQIAELGLTDLRFTLDETTQFLNGKLGMALLPDDLMTLQERTEGWPAGLRLLASSLDRIPDRAGRRAFVQTVAHTPRYIFDFLAEEVLERQEPALRTFLLETSILDELTPTRCQAVTGRGDAPALLEDLYRRNLFITTVRNPQSPVYQSTNLPIYQSTNLLIYQSTNLLIYRSTNLPIYRSTATTPSSLTFSATGWYERCPSGCASCTAGPPNPSPIGAGPSGTTWRPRCGTWRPCTSSRLGRRSSGRACSPP